MTRIWKGPKIWLSCDCAVFIIEDEPIWCATVRVFRVMWHGPNDGRIILWGYMPVDKFLLDIPDGTTIEIRHAECCERDDYANMEPVAKFKDCRIRRKWLPRPSGGESVMTAYVELSCDIEVADAPTN